MSDWCITGAGWVGANGPGRAGDPASPRFTPGVPETLRLRDLFTRAEGRSGRLDPFSKVGLFGMSMALIDGGHEPTETGGPRYPMALVGGSGFGCLETDRLFYETALPEGGALASPNLFAYTLPNCFLGEVALRFGLTGPTHIVTDAQPHGLAPVHGALDLLETGMAPAAVAGFVDVPLGGELLADRAPLYGAGFILLEAPDVKTPPRARLTRRGDAVLVDGAPMTTRLDLIAHCGQP